MFFQFLILLLLVPFDWKFPFCPEVYIPNLGNLRSRIHKASVRTLDLKKNAEYLVPLVILI